MFSDKNLEVKERILAVAGEMFIQHGYNATSVRDIAKAAGTNVAMVNYYFGTKYNLFEIIFSDALQVLFGRVMKIVSSDKPIFELIASWIDSYYETLMEYPQIPMFLMNAISQNPERLVMKINEYQPYNIFLKVTTRLEQEAKLGVIRETPSLDFLLNILSLCVFPFMFGSMATKVAGRTGEEYNDVLENHKKYVINFVINALKP